MVESLALLDRLVAFPTVSRDSNLDLIRFAEASLAAAGIASTILPDDTGRKANLFASVGPACEGGVVLSGHTDVVPVDGQAWSSDPFRLREDGGAVFGRGTADMKGFIACALVAMKQGSKRKLKRPLHLALSYDEEIGCVGVRPMLDRLAADGLRPSFVWVGEPTSMRVALGHKGKVGARAICVGHAAHSALAPTGLNAIHLACDFIGDLRALQDELAATGTRDEAYDVTYTTVHAGVIRGGTVVNIVPDHCSVDFEVRAVAPDDPSRFMDRIFDQATKRRDAVRSRFPAADIRFEPMVSYPGLATDRASPVARLVADLCEDANFTKVAFGTEAGLFQAALGAPAVVCGPGSMDQGHKPDEFVTLDQLGRCDAALARLVDHLSQA